MWHLAPFAAGVIMGAAALRLFRSGKTSAGLEKTQDRLRDATVSGLQAIENASARARARLGEHADDAGSGSAPGTEAGAPAATPTEARDGDPAGTRKRVKATPQRRKPGSTKGRAS